MTLIPAVPLAAEGLTRRFGPDTVVDALDLVVPAGEVHAVVGLNGAGKTTAMRLLLGMLRPDAGRATVMGRDVATAPSHIWAQVGHLIETPFAYPELTVEENLEAAALLHGASRIDAVAMVGKAVEEFQLVRWSAKPARSLSLGNRQRLGLAAAMLHRPGVLILDEPANALDPAGVVFIRDLLTAQAEQGAAVLVSSHHLDELARVADRILVLHRGSLVGCLEPDGGDMERHFFDLVYDAELAFRAGVE